MANRQNIQVLFDGMTTKHVAAYMQKNGWVLSESQNPEVTAFEFGSDDDHRRIWIWTSPDNPKFRSRIQNLVFSLAVQNGVEPIEIANAIADAKIEENVDPGSSENATPRSDRFEVVLLNTGGSTELMLEGGWAKVCLLAGGQRIAVVGEGLSESPEISFSGSRITIGSSSPDRIRVFCIGATLNRPSNDGDQIRKTVEVAFGEHGIAQADSLIRSLGPQLERAAFELSDVNLSPGFERFVLKSVAALLASIVNALPASEGEQCELLWLVCNQVLSDLQLAVELFPDCQKLLWQSAESDEPASPKLTFDWLNDRVIARN